MNALDGYLLDGSPAKAEVVAALLAERDSGEPAQPFYRALEALGAKIPDDALMALRIALTGRLPDDDDIRTMRAQVAAARAGDADARAAYLAGLGTPR